MHPPVVADHVPHRAPRGARGGHPLSLATQWAKDTTMMPQGLATMMYGSCPCRRRCRCCSEMPCGGQRADWIVLLLLLLILQEEFWDLR